MALSVPVLFGGALITETIFSWPGMGSLIYEAIIGSDYYVAIIGFLISASLVMVGNLLADVLYAVIAITAYKTSARRFPTITSDAEIRNPMIAT